MSTSRAARLCLACLLLWVPVQGLAVTVDVVIEGLSGEAFDNVRASLSILRRGNDDALDDETVEELHQRAPMEIRRALQPFGFYRPEITSELIAGATQDDAWRAAYRIEAGSRVAVESLELKLVGVDESLQRELRSSLAMEPGLPLDHRDYEQDKQNLLRALKDRGYLDAQYAESRVEVDVDQYIARVILHVDAGPLYVIGPVTFEQDRFAPEYLARYLLLEEGQPFERALISRQRAALSRSGHFREVNILQGDPIEGERPAVPLHITLTPYKPNRYRARVGWGTDTEFGVQADWTRRYLGKRGHQFTIGGTAVQDRDRLAGDASYVIPLDPMSGHRLELAARHESKDLTFEDVELEEGGDTRIDTNLLSVFWHRPDRFLGGFEWQLTAGLSFVKEDYDVFEVLFGNLDASDQQIIIDFIGPRAFDTLTPDFEALVPGLRFAMRRSDDPLYIRTGDFYKMELLGSHADVGSNITFWQARFNSWNIRPLCDRARLLLRSALGYSDAKSSTVLDVNFNELPEYYEFRTGGARSVRGYEFEELIGADSLTGGKYLAVASVEYEHEIIPDWSAAVFLDGGNAFNDLDDFDEKLGTGIGVRWRSPVGMARLDLGIPLDDSEDSFQVYITVGPEF